MGGLTNALDQGVSDLGPAFKFGARELTQRERDGQEYGYHFKCGEPNNRCQCEEEEQEMKQLPMQEVDAAALGLEIVFNPPSKGIHMPDHSLLATVSNGPQGVNGPASANGQGGMAGGPGGGAAGGPG